MISKHSIATSATALTPIIVVLAPLRARAADDETNRRVEQIYHDCGEEWGGAGACELSWGIDVATLPGRSVLSPR
jgi:hypothetical protein